MPTNSAPELLSPSRSPATPAKPPPAFAAIAAIIAIPDVDCGSGGMSCVVDVYDFGIRNATRVETRRPNAPARRKNCRHPQTRRSRSACHLRESSSDISGRKISPSTGCGAVSGCCLAAVSVTSPFLSALPFHTFYLTLTSRIAARSSIRPKLQGLTLAVRPGLGNSTSHTALPRTASLWYPTKNQLSGLHRSRCLPAGDTEC